MDEEDTLDDNLILMVPNSMTLGGEVSTFSYLNLFYLLILLIYLFISLI